MVHGVDVDVESPVPRVSGSFEQAAIRRASRAMDQHIQVSQGRHGLLDAAKRFLGVRYVSRHGEYSAIQGFDLPSYTLCEQVVSRQAADRDVGTARSEFERRSRTDAAAAAGYQADLPFKFHIVLFAAPAFTVASSLGRPI
jgi:hypothetical protein